MRPHVLVASLAVALLAACGGDEEAASNRVIISGQGAAASTGPVEPARAEIESGNAAYAQGDYQAALRHYEEATRLEPEAAAAWFGVSMAQTALGNQQAADAAMQRVQELAPDAPWGDHPATPDTARPPS